MKLHAIGRVEKTDAGNAIVIDKDLADGLFGIEQFSHIIVCYWLHENDTPEKRKTLKVHPCKNPSNPLTGVFATHSPRRPNPLAISICELRSIDGVRLEIGEIDAFDGSPVIDIKCYIDASMPRDGARSPNWER
jgi:tRNA (adenine37-N6)-methyltransferase